MNTCEGCPLQGQPRVYGYGKKGGLAIVGEAPGNREIIEGKPFVGMSGRLLRQSLQNVGVNPGDIWITNSVLCHPERNITPSKEAIERCRPRLLEELKQCKKVLLCGATALQSLVSETDSILKSRGRGLLLPELNIYGVLTIHPALVLRNPFYFIDFARDVDKIVNQEYIPPPPLPEIVLCKNIAEVYQAFLSLEGCETIAVDIETTSLDPLEGEIILIGLQGQQDKTYQIPNRFLKVRRVQERLQRLLMTRRTVGHNAVGFDSKWLKYRLGIHWHPTVDTMLAHYSIDERSRDEEDEYEGMGGATGIHGLKTLARIYFNAPDYDKPLRQYLAEVAKQRYKQVRQARKKGEELMFVQPNFGDVPIEELSKYLAQDTLYTFLLEPILVKAMEEEKTKKLHDELLVPGALALKDVELNGVLIDQKALLEAEETFRKDVEENVAKLREMANDSEFNVNSPKQVGHLLFDILHLPKISGYSTSKEVLEDLKSKHSAVELILDCRQKEKMRSTYIYGILQRLSKDGRLRGEFLLHGTKTGRLASRNPNLQNIPVLVGPVIRDAFVATPGWTLVEADYSQLELRVAAWYSQDSRLLEYYRIDQDVHRMVASEVFGVPPEEVTQMQRYIAKYIDFGIIYGRQAESLAKGELQCSVDEAQKYLDSFLNQFQGLARWMKKIHGQVLTKGYVETPLGRKRRFPFLSDVNRAESFRQAVNAPIQSLASDICLHSLILLQKNLRPSEARILLTVHDSLLFEVRNDCVDRILPLIRLTMENHLPIESNIPFKVDIKIGQRWGALDKRQEK